MQALSAFPAITVLIDGVIAFTLFELAVLVARHRLTGKGPAWRDYGMNLLSGLCLMFALRCLARDSGSAWVAAFLLAAGLAHGTGMLRLLRRAAQC